MIILRFTSGLGNQMFQYAFYRYLKNRYPKAQVLADTSWYEWNMAHQGFELTRIFKRDSNPDFVFEEADKWQVLRASGMLPQTSEKVRYINRLVRLFAGGHFEKQRLSETGREDENLLKSKVDNIDINKDTYITGYFLKEDYYKDNLAELRKALSFDLKSLDEKNDDTLKYISGCSSVAMHVRRGDYLTTGKEQGFLSLGMDYYKAAVELIKGQVENPRFFLFSDDKEFLEREFAWLDDKFIVSGNNGDDSYKDMLLMSRCRHIITANSTFSEWAGLLNPHDDAIVVYPRAYLSDKDSDIKTIKGWIRL